MKVVIVSNRDLKGGGAYLAALRLTRALRENGVDTQMLVKEKQSDEEFVEALTQDSPWTKIKAFLKEYSERLYLFTRIKSKENRFNFSLGRQGLNIEDHPLIVSADVVHFHWINKAFVSLESFSRIAEMGKGLVWTMHDMWAFTGGCHYSGECTKYRSNCGSCPVLGSGLTNDLSRSTWVRKNELYKRIRISGVTCSEWLERSARRSRLWSGFDVRTINNAIDTDFFAPGAVSSGTKKRTMLFIARHVDDHRKGLDLLKEAIQKYLDITPEGQQRLRLNIVGEYERKMDFGVETNYLGFVGSREELRSAYLTSDIFALPSREDNLPNTLVEASSCGLVSVAFGVGGVPEMIDDGETGYLLEPGNVQSLADVIRRLIDMPQEDLNKMKDTARELALKKYSPGAVAEKYLSVYKEMLD
ncbi:MAG: glycosyltransferase [Saprospiraceae bacterium]|nr:glycosyltransferase [Saprospiraceae bacterium]